MKSDIHQPACAAGLHLWDARYRLRIEHPITNDPQASGTFRHKHTAVRKKREAPRMRQTFTDDGDANASRALIRVVSPRPIAQRYNRHLLLGRHDNSNTRDED